MAAEPRWYLVDTSVLSNRSTAETDASVVAWLERYARKIRISVVTVAEMHRGLLLQELKVTANNSRKVLRSVRSKRAWYTEVLERFGDRIEPIDLHAAQKWAEISVRFPSLRDGDKAIAASALARGYDVATRNLAIFGRQAYHWSIHSTEAPGTTIGTMTRWQGFCSLSRTYQRLFVSFSLHGG